MASEKSDHSDHRHSEENRDPKTKRNPPETQKRRKPNRRDSTNTLISKNRWNPQDLAERSMHHGTKKVPGTSVDNSGGKRAQNPRLAKSHRKQSPTWNTPALNLIKPVSEKKTVPQGRKMSHARERPGKKHTGRQTVRCH